MCDIIIRNPSETYYAWLITALAPWSSVPTRTLPTRKSIPTRPSEIARDSLRSGNKARDILDNSAKNFKDVISMKESLLGNKISGTAPEIRRTIGISIRTWKSEWRLCVLLAILQEIMAGGDFFQGEPPRIFLHDLG